MPAWLLPLLGAAAGGLAGGLGGKEAADPLMQGGMQLRNFAQDSQRNSQLPKPAKKPTQADMAALKDAAARNPNTYSGLYNSLMQMQGIPNIGGVKPNQYGPAY
jgi:hypothetical protein